jgi:hypothetical protein
MFHVKQKGMNDVTQRHIVFRNGDKPCWSRPGYRLPAGSSGVAVMDAKPKPKPARCPICGRMLGSPAALGSHMGAHARKDGVPLVVNRNHHPRKRVYRVAA